MVDTYNYPGVDEVFSSITDGEIDEARKKLNQCRGVRVSGPAVEGEVDHFYICTDCGQSVDKRLFGDVLWHASQGHPQIKADA